MRRAKVVQEVGQVLLLALRCSSSCQAADGNFVNFDGSDALHLHRPPPLVHLPVGMLMAIYTYGSICFRLRGNLRVSHLRVCIEKILLLKSNRLYNFMLLLIFGLIYVIFESREKVQIVMVKVKEITKYANIEMTRMSSISNFNCLQKIQEKDKASIFCQKCK